MNLERRCAPRRRLDDPFSDSCRRHGRPPHRRPHRSGAPCRPIPRRCRPEATESCPTVVHFGSHLSCHSKRHRAATLGSTPRCRARSRSLTTPSSRLGEASARTRESSVSARQWPSLARAQTPSSTPRNHVPRCGGSCLADSNAEALPRHSRQIPRGLGWRSASQRSIVQRGPRPRRLCPLAWVENTKREGAALAARSRPGHDQSLTRFTAGESVAQAVMNPGRKR